MRRFTASLGSSSDSTSDSDSDSDSGSGSDSTSDSGSTRRVTGDRPSVRFLLFVGLVLAASVVVRLVLLGRQSYWIDELFSVNESSASFRRMLRIGSTEIHTPFYAALLWVWMKIGSTHEVWTRSLSTLCAVIAVPVTYRGLAAVRLGDHVRWALTVALAAGGTSIVYSLETRSYALLLLGSAGLTVVTLRAALLTLSGADIPRRVYLSWAGWVTLAATAHLFGAVLTFGAVTVLVVVTVVRAPRASVRRVLTWAVLAAAGCALQVAWVVHGLQQPEFASGTDWIRAPNRADLWDLATTTFSSGTMKTHTDGFAWISPIGVLSVVALVLLSAGYGYRARRRTAQAEVTGPVEGTSPVEVTREAEVTREGQAAAVLLALATIVIVLVFGISQWKHVWTLRNMVIVMPALVWGVICLSAWAARTAAGRRRVATVVVALLGLSLIPTTIGLTHPYKTDFRGLLDYLSAVQAEQPAARAVFIGRDSPKNWRAASGRPDDPVLAAVYRQAIRYRRLSAYPKPPLDGGARPSETEVVVYYPGVASRHFEERAASLLARFDQSSCRRIPIHGLIVIRCH
ncbi:MAG TPA: hypothetical protein VLL08_26690 [Kineosporiaceae bacterium]|nr:hypothetical protein [Kineosporiaceae bacterium]